MSEKKTFGFKATEGQREIIDKAIKKAKEVYSTDLKNMAAFSIFFNWLEHAKAETMDGGEIVTVTVPTNLEDLCELGFLRKIIDRKSGVRLWHCLKHLRPDGNGKPILMGDGIDNESIQVLCEVCKLGFVWHEQRSNLGKARAAIAPETLRIMAISMGIDPLKIFEWIENV